MTDQLTRFRFNTHVERGRRLYGTSGKILYCGTLRTDNVRRVLIVEMTESVGRHEGFFYRTLSGHEHVIRTFGDVENPDNLTIYVQEFAHYGDLGSLLLSDEQNVSETILMEMFRQIADAMSYLAHKSVVHGDLGCRNILVYQIDQRNISKTLVKITDFGLARSRTNLSLKPTDDSIIPIRYCAPEILENNIHANYTEKSDVYSMGVLMWEALSKGEVPYSSTEKDDDVQQEKLRGTLLTQPAGCNRVLWELITSCWPRNPNERKTFDELKYHLGRIPIDQTLPTPVRRISMGMFNVQEFRQNQDIQLNGTYSAENRIYQMTWVSQRERPPSILVRLDKPVVTAEFSFYNRTLQHRNLVEVFGFFRYDPSTFMIVQESATHGSLRSVLIEQNFRPTERVLIALFIQIIDVMIYLTSQQIVHGDLRCDNVLVFQMDPNDPEKNLLKLTDFQSVQSIADPTRPIERRSNLSIRHCAPEIIRSAGQGNFSEMSEVYSMGVLMWEVCSGGQQPFSSFALDSEVRQLKLKGEKLPQLQSCNPSLWSIMNDCWYNEPLIRFNFMQMKTRLEGVRRMSMPQFPFELNVDVRRRDRLFGRPGKQFYAAEWIQQRRPKIVLLTMDEQTAQQELRFFSKFSSHPHIIRTFGRVQCHDQFIHIIQERAKYGDLQSFLSRGEQRLNDEMIIDIFLQIIDAMSALRREKIIHGDLSCANILICQINPNQAEKTLVKLTNFHQAFYEENPPTFNRTDSRGFLEHYGAIELLNATSSSSYTEYSEVYSMGILMWQVYAQGQVPFASSASRETVRIRRLNGEGLTKPNNCRDNIWTIIETCFFREPSLRSEFRHLLIRLNQLKITGLED